MENYNAINLWKIIYNYYFMENYDLVLGKL